MQADFGRLVGLTVAFDPEPGHAAQGDEKDAYGTIVAASVNESGSVWVFIASLSGFIFRKQPDEIMITPAGLVELKRK